MIKSFDGKTPCIAETAYISEAACIIGEVEIGEGSGVWPGAVIRADFAPIRIGHNTFIEDNCVVHTGRPMDIGDNIIVGHGVVLHGLSISSNTLIGSNATVLDGTRIGRFCIIGAGCLVSQGMIVPDYSLVVGVPAKIKGRVPAHLLEDLERGLRVYTDLTQAYRRQGL